MDRCPLKLGPEVGPEGQWRDRSAINKLRRALGPALSKTDQIMKLLHKISIASAVLATAGVCALSLRGDEDKRSDSWKQVVIDVACDATTFALNTAKPSDTGPARGASFIVNGKIYPGGTIPSGNGFDINTPGAIGTWVCRGAFTGGTPAQASTQGYFFGPPGMTAVDDSLASVGEEGGVTTHRPVTGGTGFYRGVVGEVKQEILGQNTSGLFNFRFTFTVKRAE